MNDDRLLGLLRETDPYPDDGGLPGSLRSRAATFVEIQRRVDAPLSVNGNGRDAVLSDEAVPVDQIVVEPREPVSAGRSGPPWPAIAASLVLLVGIGALLVWLQNDGGDSAPLITADDPVPTDDQPPPSPDADAEVATPAEQEWADAGPEEFGGPLEIVPPDPSGAAPARSSPPPDLAGAVPGDDGTGPIPLGTIEELPGTDYLDFLYEECEWSGVQGCFRDAHFMTPETLPEGSGPFEANRPFHVRHGFVNNGPEPLGDGFDVVVYMIPMNGAPSEGGGVPAGSTIRYTSDYVMRATTDQCGPTYRTQTEPVTCEWFVHEFADGLTAGRWAMWAYWEAPCRAWVDLGFTDGCADPDEVLALFTAGVDSPIDGPGSGSLEQGFEGLEEGFGPPAIITVPDASGAAPAASSPLPDIGGAVVADDGSPPQPLGTVDVVPDTVRLDFLYEECEWSGVQGCFRDAHFMTPETLPEGTGVFEAGRPFHVRHGFLNDEAAPLGDGFDVAVYMISMNGAPSEDGGGPAGSTIRYASDYVVRGTADQCGPTYRSQTGPVTCEWFVHEFADGLTVGRWAMWAYWEAPCRAWVELGFADECADPDEVLTLFTAGVDSPLEGP